MEQAGVESVTFGRRLSIGSEVLAARDFLGLPDWTTVREIRRSNLIPLDQKVQVQVGSTFVRRSRWQAFARVSEEIDGTLQRRPLLRERVPFLTGRLVLEPDEEPVYQNGNGGLVIDTFIGNRDGLELIGLSPYPHDKYLPRHSSDNTLDLDIDGFNSHLAIMADVLGYDLTAAAAQAHAQKPAAPVAA